MGNTTVTKNKGTEVALATQLVAGTQKHFASIATLMFASGSFTPAQVVAQLQQLITFRTDVDTARSALEAKLATETAQAPAVLTFMRGYMQFVKTTFSKSPDVLADFGLKPNKAKTPLTVEQKAAAAAKREATRAARGTKGSKAKQAIKGNVTGVVVTPVTAAPPAAATGTTSSTNAPANAQGPSAPAAPLPKS